MSDSSFIYPLADFGSVYIMCPRFRGVHWNCSYTIWLKCLNYNLNGLQWMIAWIISSYIVANTRLNFPICVSWKIGEIKFIIYVIKPINNCVFIAYFLKLWFLKLTFHIDFFFNPRNTNPVPRSIHPGKRHIAINTILPDISKKIYNHNHQDIMNGYEEFWIFEIHTYLNVIHIEVLSFALSYVNWKMYDEMV